jgi:putative transposase
MCRLMGVNRHSYYSFQRREKHQPEEPEHQAMLAWIKKVAEASQYTYGSRRMRKSLNGLGYPIGIRKTKRLMKEAGIFVRYRKKYKVTTNSKHKKPLFDNVLNRQFTVSGPDQAYVSDITYINTQEGWLYLAVVIDLFSRKVVGWSMGARMKAALVCDALKRAVWQRKPKRGLVVHSDRGSQYASHDYRQLLSMYGCVGSMSRKGNCWDNAVAESFFGSLKQERVQWCSYRTRYEAQQDVLNYISMFYNCYRLHSTLGYMNPNQFERFWENMKKAA